MRWQLRLAPISVVLLLASGSTFAQKGAKTANYYPLQAGNTWDYKITVDGKTVDAVSHIAKIEMIDGVSLARLEATIKGNIAATEHLRQTSEGVFRHRNNGQEISPPICLLKYPVKDGAKWDGDITIGAEKGKYTCESKEEKIEVAGTKYKAMRVAIHLESQGKTITTTYWFVQDVGFVRQTVEAGELNIVMELQKFEKGKK
jgi:hypothetical protein